MKLHNKLYCILSLISLLNTGCVDRPKQQFPVYLSVDDTFSDVQVELIKAAFDDWYVMTEGRVDIRFDGLVKTNCDIDTVIDGKQYVVHNCLQEDSMAKNIANTYTPKFIGYANTNLICLVPSKIKNDKMFYAVMLHELGHFLGLKNHSDTKSSLMFYKTSEYHHIDDETIDSINRLYGWNIVVEEEIKNGSD